MADHQNASPGAATPSLSVLIPTYGRGPALGRLLGGLAAQTLAPYAFEVIVVDDGSSDGSADGLLTPTSLYRAEWVDFAAFAAAELPTRPPAAAVSHTASGASRTHSGTVDAHVVDAHVVDADGDAPAIIGP